MVVMREVAVKCCFGCFLLKNAAKNDIEKAQKWHITTQKGKHDIRLLSEAASLPSVGESVF